jgi:multidrug resistance efflux pump
MQQATNNYNSAQAAYESLKTHPTASELQQAAAQVAQAQDALARLQPTSQDLAVAQASVEQARSALDAAQQQLADATLKAPSAGTVLWVGPANGETVSPGTPVLILADLSSLQFQAGVDENVAGQVHPGQAVIISPDEFPGQQVRGIVSRIGNLATSTSGVVNIPVTIDLAPSNLRLRPGLTAKADIEPNP